MEDKLLAFVSKALNIDIEEVKETLSEDGGEDKLLQLDATRIKTIKDNGYKAGERKVNTAWENKIKAELNIQSDKKGLELLDEVQLAMEEKAATPNPAEITEAVLKKHPAFLQLEKQAAEAAKVEAEKWQKVIAERDQAEQQKELFNEVKGHVLPLIDSLKPVLSEDANKAALQKSVVINELLSQYGYMKNGNEILLLNKQTGERLENEQGHPIRLEDKVKETTTKYYDLQVSEARSSSARQPNEQTTTALPVPKNKAEYVTFLADTTIDSGEKQKVIDAYNAAS